MRSTAGSRRYPVGAEVQPGGVSFRVWAPERRSVAVLCEQSGREPVSLRPEGNGYFSVVTDAAGAGTLYQFQLDDDPVLYPDPASRFQPSGPHGPSQVVDPTAFSWTDDSWTGVPTNRLVLYELHIGTLTAEGTWQAAAARLPDLVDVGITAIEVMPVADFPGQFGWGYDGVNLFAPTRLYGTPDDFRQFVDRAHALGLGVVLDVVYNHLGPDGNYLPRFSPHVFSERYDNEWGDALNFDGEHSQPMREFICANAAYWIEEYHLDGLRLDATHSIHDASTPHILAEITGSARAAAGRRQIFVVAENEPQNIAHIEPAAAGGYGMDAIWNDDFHHSAVVALRGRHEAYYTDYRGAPQEFISVMKHGFLYQGQRYDWQHKRRGTASLDADSSCFVTFLENHDQVANLGRGQRLHQDSQPGDFRAMTALLLLGPATPMLFQGQEFGSTRPFLYFADHTTELNQLVWSGRRDFLKQFSSLATPEMQALVRSPGDRSTFEDCKLDWSERERNREAVALHRDLLTLRREDAVLSTGGRLDGAVLGNEVFVVRFFAEDGGDRLLLINLGRDHDMFPAPEPLLADPEGRRWTLAWSSENPKYGGSGTLKINWDDGFIMPGHAAMFFTAEVGGVSHYE